jgi:hypothetical protein
MSDYSDSFVISIVMFVLLFIALILILISLRYMGDPLKTTLWILSKSKQITVQAEITDCKVIETAGLESSQRGSYVTSSEYNPVVEVQFENNGKTVNSEIILNNKRHLSAESAFNEIMSIAPHKKIHFIHTFNSRLSMQDGEFMKSLRLQEDPDAQYVIPLIINPDKPQENNFTYKGYSLKDWILPLIILFFSIVFILPVFLIFKQLTLKFRLTSVSFTILTAFTLYYCIPKVLTLLSIEYNTANSKSVFEITIDSNYNGTQIKPYLMKFPAQE